MRERDPEGRRLGDDPIGHHCVGERSSRHEPRDRRLGPVRELLDDAGPGARRRPGCLDRGNELLGRPHEGQSPLSLTVRRLDDERRLELDLLRRLDDLPPRLRHPHLREPPALAQLRRRQHGRLRRDRVRKAEPLRDPRRDRHGPVDARRDHALDGLRPCQPLQRRLVLVRDDRPPVGEREPDRRRVAVGRDDEQPPLPGRLEQAELSRPGA